MHPRPVSLSFERRGKEGMFIRRPNPDPGSAGGGLPAYLINRPYPEHLRSLPAGRQGSAE